MGRTVIATALLTAFSVQTASANDFDSAPYSSPKPITDFHFGGRDISLLAVTRRARADTPLRQQHLEECREMAKVYPGYPQPAFVSFDLKVHF